MRNLRRTKETRLFFRTVRYENKDQTSFGSGFDPKRGEVVSEETDSALGYGEEYVFDDGWSLW